MRVRGTRAQLTADRQPIERRRFRRHGGRIIAALERGTASNPKIHNVGIDAAVADPPIRRADQKGELSRK